MIENHEPTRRIIRTSLSERLWAALHIELVVFWCGTLIAAGQASARQRDARCLRAVAATAKARGFNIFNRLHGLAWVLA